jgi:hypothetical protein
MKRIIGLALALSLGAVPGLWAQASTGNIYGNVTDASGAILPGANITLTSDRTGVRSTTSGAQGDFRFLNLDPGTYKLAVALAGFATVNRDVVVTTGQNVNLAFAMKISQVEETVTVTAETPVVDTKRVGTATTLSKEELAQVPQSRDPWAVLKTVPGVIVDRVNVAGNESGQQSGFVGKGSQANDTQWNLDGVVITDPDSYGASSSYFDFDAFDEINVTTGGGDLKVMSGGIGINFVTKRGTNAFHGSVRGFLAHNDLQSNNTPDELIGDPRLQGSDQGVRTDQIADYGVDLGGPIIKDKLWFWGSYGKQDIRIVRLAQTRDRTILKNWNGKMNWQPGKNDMVSLFWFNGAKVKYGRDPGQAGTSENSFLWNQGNFYPEENCGMPCGLHGLWKLEWNHTFSSNFYLNAKYAYYGWGYGFAPIGGTDQNAGVDTDLDHAYGSWVTYTARKPWKIGNLDGNYFVNGWGGQHELKFGFGYRKHPSVTTTTFSGDGLVGFNQGGGNTNVWVTRQRNVKFEGDVLSLYGGDTFTKGRMTLNLGVRYDQQKAHNSPSTAQGNPAFPDLLPSLAYDGSGTRIDWKNVVPRVGLTYALNESRRTVLRASYSMYAGQLGHPDATFNSPVGAYYPFLAYKWIDKNGDHIAQKEEVLLDQGVQYSNAIDPNNPTAVTAVNKIDPNYKANKDHEVIVGIDHELGGNFAVGLGYTWRHVADIPGYVPRIGLTSADYSQSDAGLAAGFSPALAYGPDQALVDASGSGRILTNRPDYHTGYSGLEVTAVKRLSNKWFLRGAFSYMDWKEYPGPGSIQNPTRTDAGSQAGINGFAGPQVDGGQIAPRSGGSGKGDIFFNAKWQFVANALYQLPANFEIATSVFGRQGYAKPPVYRLGAGADGTLRVMATGNLDDLRYGSVWDADFRLANRVKLGGRAQLEISADLFNAFNNNVTLGQTRTVTASSYDTINDYLAPRILRIGLRLLF